MLIADLDLLKEVTVKQFEHFCDLPPLPDLLRTSSKSPRGIFTARGDYWKKLRVTLSPTFSPGKMKMVNMYVCVCVCVCVSVCVCVASPI